jgi:hypothetical protein
MTWTMSTAGPAVEQISGRAPGASSLQRMRVWLTGVALFALVLGSSACTTVVSPPPGEQQTAAPSGSPGPSASGSLSPEGAVADAQSLPGVFHETISVRDHTDDPVDYDRTPPIGGKHVGVWADCTGTVYTAPISDETAVHSLEHGAVWVTYRPDLPADQVSALAGVVDGHNYTFLSPYPDQQAAVSLQAWGWQLGLERADVDTVRRFIRDLAGNPANAPEPQGICANPEYKASPSPPR